MNARFAWYDEGGQIWSETQDIIIYPGCNRMTIDLATIAAVAVNDENTIYKAGWRGQRITALRFDLNEDPGVRNFSLRDIRLADDAAFASGTYPITFSSTHAAGRADIFVTTDAGQRRTAPRSAPIGRSAAASTRSTGTAERPARTARTGCTSR